MWSSSVEQQCGAAVQSEEKQCGAAVWSSSVEQQCGAAVQSEEKQCGAACYVSLGQTTNVYIYSCGVACWKKYQSNASCLAVNYYLGVKPKTLDHTKDTHREDTRSHKRHSQRRH
ncbi:hypothetical protein BgiBS90_003544 [Biomphalaria glabrata]|nr:hypothetical protein BgiBS90_003544 [Biomphalaria glabrata]